MHIDENFSAQVHEKRQKEEEIEAVVADPSKGHTEMDSGHKTTPGMTQMKGEERAGPADTKVDGHA